jgi:TonB family protein
MRPVSLRIAIAAVRLWTDLYTRRLPSEVRDARRAEIASDIWHSTHDPDRDRSWPLALEMIVRLLFGLPDDVRWRVEQMEESMPSRRVAVAVGLCGVLALGLAGAFWGAPLPAVPPAPDTRMQAVHEYPPPPPPPPPARPGGSPDSSYTRPETVYAKTSYTVATDGVAPRRVKEVRPVYPPILLANDVEGIVVVEATITDAGRVGDAHVVRPAGILSHSAMAAVQQWEFAPADAGPMPPRSTLTVTVNFTRP